MAITVTTETNVAITAGLAVEVVDALVGRKSITVQVQATGDFWCALSGTAAVGVGFKAKGWEVINVDAALAGNGNTTDFYEGPVSIFWPGSGFEPFRKTSAVVRVMEMS